MHAGGCLGKEAGHCVGFIYTLQKMRWDFTTVEWKLPINYTFHPGGFEMLAEITLTTVVHYHQQGGY